MSAPTVSVIMSTYNHGGLVAQTIESVLAQQDVSFEFLVADDGSSDETREVVASYKDPRLHFFPNKVNQGACAVLNQLLARASGEYVAVINSDDFWTSDDKLAYQAEFLRGNPDVGACFGRVRFVDKDGQALDKTAVPHGAVFDQQNRSRAEWLRFFYRSGNCLCHPTVLIRRACYDAVGTYDNRLRQLPDYDMWIRLVKQFDIHIDDREFIAFRYLGGENTSSNTPANLQRLLNETYFILRRFFDDVSPELFLAGFGDLLTSKATDDSGLRIEQALLFLDKECWAPRIYNLIGLEMIHELLQDEPHNTLLAEEYGIDDLRFQAMAGDVDSFWTADPVRSLADERGRALLAELLRRARWRVSREGRAVRSAARHEG